MKVKMGYNKEFKTVFVFIIVYKLIDLYYIELSERLINIHPFFSESKTKHRIM